MSTWRCENQLLGLQTEAAKEALPTRIADRQKPSLVCYSGALQSAGRALAVPSLEGGAKHEVTIYDLQQTDPAAPVKPTVMGTISSAGPVRSASWHGPLLALGGTGGSVSIHHVQLLADERGRSASDRLRTESAGTLQIPDVVAASLTRVPPSAPATSTAVTCMAATMGGQLVLGCGSQVAVFAPDNNADATTPPSWLLRRESGAPITCVAADPVQGAIVATGCTNGRIELLDLRLPPTPVAHASTTSTNVAPRVSAMMAESISFCPSFSNIFAVSRGRGMVQVYDSRCLSGAMETIGDAANGLATQVAFVPRHSDLLAVGSSLGQVRLWSVRSSPAFSVATVCTGSGDSVVSLFATPFDECDGIISFDRSGVLNTAMLTESLVGRAAPSAQDALRAIAALKAVNEPGATAPTGNSMGASLAGSFGGALSTGAKVVKKFSNRGAEEMVSKAVRLMYLRKASDAAITIAEFAKDAVARGAAEEATFAADLADQLKIEPPLYENVDSALHCEQLDTSVMVLAYDIAMRRCSFAIPHTLHEYVEAAEVGECMKHGVELSDDAAATIEEMRSQLAFVAALVSGSAEELVKYTDDLVQAAEKGALDAELVASAIRILLDNGNEEQVFTTLTGIAQVFIGRSKTSTAAGSLAVAAAVFRVAVEPMTIPRPHESLAVWARSHFSSPKAVAVTGSLIAACLGFTIADNPVITAENFAHLITQYDSDCPAIESGSPAALYSPLARIPSPAFAKGVLQCLTEMGQHFTPRLLKYAVEYHVMIQTICHGPDTTGGADPEDDDEGTRTELHPGEALGEVEAYAEEALNTVLDAGQQIAERYGSVIDNLYSTSAAARTAAKRDFEPLLNETNDWVEAAAGAKYAISGVPGVENAGLWADFDPVSQLDEMLNEVLNGWAGLLDVISDDGELKSTAMHFVHKLMDVAEAMAQELDLDAGSDAGGILGGILDEGGRFVGVDSHRRADDDDAGGHGDADDFAMDHDEEGDGDPSDRVSDVEQLSDN